jgi:potassium efflux system protein
MRFRARGLLAVSTLLMLAVAPTMAQEKPQPGSTPSSIPIPEIAARAEEVTTLLRTIETLLASDADIEAIRQRLPELTRQINARLEETTRSLDGRPSIEALDTLFSSWQRARSELARALEKLTQRATRLEDELERLAGVFDIWKRTRADALASKAPRPVLERIDALLAAIPQAQKRLPEERSAVLVLQDRVARQLAKCEDGLDRVASFRQGYVGQLLVRDTVPVWSREAGEQAWTDFVANAREAYQAKGVHLREFVGEEFGRVLVLVAVFVGLTVLLQAARRQAHLRHLVDERGFSVELVVARPVATALVVTTLTFFWNYPHAPRAAIVLVSMIALVAVTRSIAPLVGPWQVRWLRAFGAFFLADRLRDLFAVVPRFERQLFLLEMLVGAGAVGWMLYRNRATLGRGEQERTWGVNKITGMILVPFIGFTIAFLAGATGYMSLGRQLGYGTLTSVYVALALSAGIRVAYGLMVLLLRVQPLSRLQIVRRYRALLERRIFGVFKWIAVAIWLRAALTFFGIWTSVAATVRSGLTAHLAWGSLQVSLGDVLAFVLTLWLAVLVSRFLRFVLEEDVFSRRQLAPGASYAISNVLHYAILFLGFLLAMAALGLDLTKLTIIGGAIGVGVGFGLQNVVNNFISGLIVLFERPVRVGDAVQIGDISGQVRRIGIRSSTVRTWDGAEVIVPNATLVSERVTNWTPTDRRRRLSLPVGVSYGSAPEKVLTVLRAVAGAHSQVLSDPAPQPLFMGFGESALLFELRVWTDGLTDWQQVRSELAVALNAALGEAGIGIAFPVREVYLRKEASADVEHRMPPGTMGPDTPSQTQAE